MSKVKIILEKQQPKTVKLLMDYAKEQAKRKDVGVINNSITESYFHEYMGNSLTLNRSALWSDDNVKDLTIQLTLRMVRDGVDEIVILDLPQIMYGEDDMESILDVFIGISRKHNVNIVMGAYDNMFTNDGLIELLTNKNLI